MRYGYKPTESDDFMRYESTGVLINANPVAVFEKLDDHRALASHMSNASWMMAGSSMNMEMDDKKGRGLGSVIKLRGRFLGIPLSLEEVVTEYSRSIKKTWATVGEPKLLIIGSYRMGFDLTSEGVQTRVNIWIEYDLPIGWAQKFLGKSLGSIYARWCVQQMMKDVQRAF